MSSFNSFANGADLLSLWIGAQRLVSEGHVGNNTSGVPSIEPDLRALMEAAVIALTLTVVSRGGVQPQDAMQVDSLKVDPSLVPNAQWRSSSNYEKPGGNHQPQTSGVVAHSAWLPAIILTSTPAIIRRSLNFHYQHRDAICPLLFELAPSPQNADAAPNLAGAGTSQCAIKRPVAAIATVPAGRKRRVQAGGNRQAPSNVHFKRIKVSSDLTSVTPPSSTVTKVDSKETNEQAAETFRFDFLLSGSCPLAHAGVDKKLAKYQIAIRQQVEIFVVDKKSLSWSVRGRKKPVRIGQVGIRCRHCKHLPHFRLETGSSYFPTRMPGVYQAAQNIARTHLLKSCKSMDDSTRRRLQSLCNEGESTLSGGKQEWIRGCKELGVYEAEDGLGLRMRKGSALNP